MSSNGSCMYIDAHWLESRHGSVKPIAASKLLKSTFAKLASAYVSSSQLFVNALSEKGISKVGLFCQAGLNGWMDGCLIGWLLLSKLLKSESLNLEAVV